MHVCVWSVNTFPWAHALIFRVDVPYQRALARYMQGLIAWPVLPQLLSYSKHTIWQKDVFICFPGGFHNGRYLFNKVNPRELQRLLRDSGGVDATLLFFQWFTLMSANAVGVAVLHFLRPGLNPIIKTTSCAVCAETQHIQWWQQWFVSCSATAHVFPSRNRCPLRLVKGGRWNALCPTTMALSLIAYFLE